MSLLPREHPVVVSQMGPGPKQAAERLWRRVEQEITAVTEEVVRAQGWESGIRGAVLSCASDSGRGEGGGEVQCFPLHSGWRFPPFLFPPTAVAARALYEACTEQGQTVSWEPGVMLPQAARWQQMLQRLKATGFMQLQ